MIYSLAKYRTTKVVDPVETSSWNVSLRSAVDETLVLDDSGWLAIIHIPATLWCREIYLPNKHQVGWIVGPYQVIPVRYIYLTRVLCKFQ